MQPELVTELLSKGGFLLGSRAFGVNYADSDWDVAISLDDAKSVDGIQAYVDEVLKFGSVSDFIITSYFHLLPPFGSGWVIRLPYVDILIFDNDKALLSLQSAVDLLKRVPSELIKQKHIRVQLFEEALLLYKWYRTPSNDYGE